jgi:hypothetical protein
MLNKRGADLIVVIIWLVLGILVAAFLIWGFSTNWNMFSSLFASNNVNIIKTQCETACASSDVYSFCTMKRTLRAEDLPLIDNKKVTSFAANCSYFAKESGYSTYGIADCPGLCK